MRSTMYFNSPGRSMTAALAIGRTLRGHSACPLAYVGGVAHFLESGSVIGVHRVANRVPAPDEAAFEHVVSAQVTQYLAEMGIGAQLLQIMEAVPHDGIRLLTADEAVTLGVVNRRSTGRQPTGHLRSASQRQRRRARSLGRSTRSN
jgi:hypothetical protein